ncbi:MAG TPA: ChbG/HpnK family deacetylase [Terracidiphilus sp.]|nr:ChbG/HpnK family deacetylase [Terracidiphilus sp.]
MRQLIINGDDFGLTLGVNRGIAELHAAGVLTSSTLMARADATDDAIRLAQSNPSLGVGCHVVLVDGTPVLSATRDVPHLVNRSNGQMPPGLVGFMGRLYARGNSLQLSQEIEAEAKAQIQFLQGKSLNLSHIDSHKHTHMFPQVLRPLLRAARAAGIRAVRNPFEPAWAVKASVGASMARVAEVSVLRWLQPVWKKILNEEGFVTTDGTIAVAGTGVLNANMVRTLLRDLPEGTWELVTHPGYNDADLERIDTRLKKSRDIEREALMAVKEFPDIRLISFRDLRPATNV